MSDHPTPGGFSWEPEPGTAQTPIHDRTSASTTGGSGVTWYTTLPDSAPGQRPPEAPRGGGKHRGRRVAAVVALAAAILITGVAVGRHFTATGLSTTSLAQPAAPGVTQQQPPAMGGSGSAPSTGSGSGGSSTPADVNAIAAKVSPAIVNITQSNDYTSSGGAATGIVLTSDGYVLTNNHVINGATDIQATDVGNGRTYSASVVGYDATHDIALVKLQDASGLTTANIGDSSSLAVGDTVVGIGNAGGDGGAPSVAAGSVVALGQQIVASDAADGTAEQLTGLIQTDADIRSGDSGGPLVNAEGAVIGVTTAASATNGSYGYGDGGGDGTGSSGNEGYAVPIATAMQIVDQIKSGNASSTVHLGETGFLGVQTTSSGAPGSGGSGNGGFGYGDPYGYGGASGGQSGSGDTGSGATVAGVVSGSPAAQAGLTAGDVITAVDGDAVTSAQGLGDLIAAHHPGDKVTVTWTDSNGAQKSASVTLTQGPAK